METFDEWLRHRLRCVKLHQLKRVYPQVKFLIAQGVKPADAWRTCKSGKGLWRLSLTPAANTGMSIDWFTKLGMLSLSKLYAEVKC